MAEKKTNKQTKNRCVPSAESHAAPGDRAVTQIDLSVLSTCSSFKVCRQLNHSGAAQCGVAGTQVPILSEPGHTLGAAGHTRTVLAWVVAARRQLKSQFKADAPAQHETA